MKFVSRLFSSQAICIRNGKARTLKGKHPEHVLSKISSTCRTNRIYAGEIWISAEGRISFSKEIPEDNHQVLRNTIHNSDA